MARSIWSGKPYIRLRYQIVHNSNKNLRCGGGSSSWYCSYISSSTIMSLYVNSSAFSVPSIFSTCWLLFWSAMLELTQHPIFLKYFNNISNLSNIQWNVLDIIVIWVIEMTKTKYAMLIKVYFNCLVYTLTSNKNWQTRYLSVQKHLCPSVRQRIIVERYEVAKERGNVKTAVHRYRCTALAHTVKISLSGFWALVI